MGFWGFGVLGQIETVWDVLGQILFGTFWDSLGRFGTDWDGLGHFGTDTFWDSLGRFGTDTFWDGLLEFIKH